jgi:hypothetical protein
MLTISGIIQTVRDTTELVVGGMSAASSVYSIVYKSGKDSIASNVRKYRLTTAKPSAIRRGVISMKILCLCQEAVSVQVLYSGHRRLERKQKLLA